MKKIDIYKDLLKTISGYAEQVKLPSSVDIRYRLEGLIQQEEISEKFGITIPDSGSGRMTWYRLSDYHSIGLYDKSLSREISWPDDGIQPQNEWLYVISFPTGAYIFGKEYPTETFKEFFLELKGYEPKYVDSVNKALYFTHENASKVDNDFLKILEKYRGRVNAELKQKRIKALQKELGELSQSNQP